MLGRSEPVPAYLIGDVEVTNPEAYAEYGRRFSATLVPFGGRLLVAGGPCEAVEGEWLPKRLVVLEFPSLQHARDWHASPDYQAIIPIRHQNAITHFVTLADGWKPPTG
jgi:uncharacterized protein (DUF1330 family)